MGWNSGDNGGTYSPGTQTSSITFKQGTTQLAATTITGTITQSTGNITLASSSTYGSPTITFSNNGTAICFCGWDPERLSPLNDVRNE